ncbi:MAG: response regulator [Alphaproteobacteria bacterium]|nr:response regulator [Alphaproteobacteria bacterium]
MRAYELSRLTVLVVDPNAFMRRILSGLLEGVGVGHVVPTATVADACDKLGPESNADMILSELDLDDYDGVDFIKMVRQHRDERTRLLPIMICSADTRMQRIIEARDAGATEFLAKPVSGETVYRRLVQLIEHPRSFVQVNDEYFGPDRRRKIKEFMGDEQRAGA